MNDRSRSQMVMGGLALLAALLAAVSIPGHQFGLNLLIVWMVLIAAACIGAREALDRSDLFFALLSLAPALLAILRSAEWVLFLQFLAAGSCALVGFARATSWRSMVGLPRRALVQLHRAPVVPLAPLARSVPARLDQHVIPAARGGLLSLLLLALFGGLFVSADAAFASLTEEWLLPEIQVDLLPARVLMFVGSLVLIGVFVRLSLVPSPAPGSPWVLAGKRRPAFALEPFEWKTALLLVDVLFGAFVIVQLAVLFGGHAHVLNSAGLSYAEYAREGFFQLVAVAVLSLGLIAVTLYFTQHDDRRTPLRVLLGVLCLLTLVVLVSAYKRMNLYQDAYGFTRMRLVVELMILWLAILFCLLIAAGIKWNGRWLPRAFVAVSVTTVVGFGLYNPDARIAERNIQRFHKTGDIDIGYLSGLSPDAVPILLELPEPHRSCTVGPILARSSGDSSVWSANLGRRRAFLTALTVGFLESPCNF